MYSHYVDFPVAYNYTRYMSIAKLEYIHFFIHLFICSISFFALVHSEIGKVMQILMFGNQIENKGWAVPHIDNLNLEGKVDRGIFVFAVLWASNELVHLMSYVHSFQISRI